MATFFRSPRLDNGAWVTQHFPIMHFKPSESRRRTRAFTLLEIMVVLAIIGLLAGLAISQLGGTFGGAQVDTAKLFVNTSIKVPLFSYKMAMGDYPSTQDGLQALISPPANKADRWRGPYLDPAKIPLDPWGEPYHYAYPGTHNKEGYDIWSAGKDGQSGTDDDVGNWDTSAPKQQ